MKAPQVRKTLIQILVKTLFRHRDLGIIAGLFRRSCLSIQRIKIGTNATEAMKRAIVVGVLMFEELPVIDLYTLS